MRRLRISACGKAAAGLLAKGGRLSPGQAAELCGGAACSAIRCHAKARCTSAAWAAEAPEAADRAEGSEGARSGAFSWRAGDPSLKERILRSAPRGNPLPLQHEGFAGCGAPCGPDGKPRGTVLLKLICSFPTETVVRNLRCPVSPDRCAGPGFSSGGCPGPRAAEGRGCSSGLLPASGRIVSSPGASGAERPAFPGWTQGNGKPCNGTGRARHPLSQIFLDLSKNLNNRNLMFRCGYCMMRYSNTGFGGDGAAGDFPGDRRPWRAEKTGARACFVSSVARWSGGCIRDPGGGNPEKKPGTG